MESVWTKKGTYRTMIVLCVITLVRTEAPPLTFGSVVAVVLAILCLWYALVKEGKAPE